MARIENVSLAEKRVGQITLPTVQQKAAELRRRYNDSIKYSDEQIIRFFQILTTTLKYCRYDPARARRSGGTQSARLLIRAT